MGWFSDKLFGKKKRLDQNKINDYMEPYNRMVDEQEGIARQMMDPRSKMNMDMQQMMRSNQFDAMASQNQSLLGMAAQTGLSPGQAAMQARQQSHSTMSNFGEQMGAFQQGQYQQGLGLLQGVMGQRQGQGELQANMYMQKINAHNARRKANMGMASSLLGAAISDKRLKKNINLVGKSSKGYNIYEFDYINKNHGSHRYRGVMAQEVPFASIKDSNGYYLVNYSHPNLDVKFERIS